MRSLVRLIAVCAVLSPLGAFALDPAKTPPITSREVTTNRIILEGSGSTGDLSNTVVLGTGAARARSQADRAADAPNLLDVTTVPQDGSADAQPSIAAGLAATPTFATLNRGTYALKAPLFVPSGKELRMERGASFAYSGGGTFGIADSGWFSGHGFGQTRDTRVWATRIGGGPRTASAVDTLGFTAYTFPSYAFAVIGDGAAIQDDAFSSALQGSLVFGDGGQARGGRIGVNGIVDQNTPTSALNTNRNYVGTQGVAISRAGDGGTDLGAGAKGAYFGLAGFCQIRGGQNILNCTGAEVNTGVVPGSNVKYLIGVQTVGGNSSQGTDFDAAYDVGGFDQFGVHVGWSFGFAFTDLHGRDPMNANSTLFGSKWFSNPATARTILTGIDLRGFNASAAGVLGKANGGGPFLRWQNAAGTTDLFSVTQAGAVNSTGTQSRAGLAGPANGNYHNFFWTGTGLQAFVDNANLGFVAFRNDAGTNVGYGTPASSTAPCAQGQMLFDASWIYTCVATNSWKRVASGAAW